MTTIRFNTDRKYTVHGQRIIATEHPDGVVTFHDLDRMIDGELTRRVDDRTALTASFVLSQYDQGNYTGSSRAWKDAFMRGGCNSTWEV